MQHKCDGLPRLPFVTLPKAVQCTVLPCGRDPWSPMCCDALHHTSQPVSGQYQSNRIMHEEGHLASRSPDLQRHAR